ncbi:hypothetical protein K0M31_005143 [Melipona bicolor]|uniref:Uncharacterized protein n=1 Tax=Melipona bicolor TaxID=60889 RepID=A0AA40FWI0_9HYME|nr:hypothetical protein K0M31_005143 [Melipona bicolor]
MNSPYAMVGGVVFGPDQSGYHGGHGDHGRFTDGVSVDVSKRTEVTNNVRAASMRPKRRDRERRRLVGWWLTKKVVVEECGVKKRTHRTDKRKSAQRKWHSSQAFGALEFRKKNFLRKKEFLHKVSLRTQEVGD